MTLLRRIYDAPDLFQLLATFGVTLAVEDLVLLIWGPGELLGPRAPGFKGAVDLLGQPFPTYDLLADRARARWCSRRIWFVFRRTHWGVLVRAATQDREMAAALGVNQKWLFTSVFALGVFLAALGGALALPREAASHTMDLPVITESLVVVVIGGLGSLPGAFLAADHRLRTQRLRHPRLPGVSIALVFVVMAIVLVVRPWGLLGRAEAAARERGRRGLFPLAPARRARPAARRSWPWRPRRFCRSSRAIMRLASRRKCSSSRSMRRAFISCSAAAVSSPSATPPISASAPMARRSR